MSIAKLQIRIAQVVILAAFSAAGFEIAAALYSWHEGAFVPKYVTLALILITAGLAVQVFYQKVKANTPRVSTSREN